MSLGSGDEAGLIIINNSEDDGSNAFGRALRIWWKLSYANFGIVLNVLNVFVLNVTLLLAFVYTAVCLLSLFCFINLNPSWSVTIFESPCA